MPALRLFKNKRLKKIKLIVVMDAPLCGYTESH